MKVDFAIDSAGNFLRESNGLRMSKTRIEYVAQKLQIKFRFFLGEWYLNTSLGLPYFTKMLEKGVDISFIEAIFKATIYKVPEIKELKTFSVTVEPASRKLKVAFSVKLTDSDNTESSNIEVSI